MAVCDTGTVSEASPLPESVRGVKPEAQRPPKFSTDEKNPDRPHLSSAGNQFVEEIMSCDGATCLLRMTPEKTYGPGELGVQLSRAGLS